VIDEPSVFDYGPQHQSICGIHFNDAGKIFGPAWWQGDIIAAGESRGKIWRTKLLKTPAGYVAQNTLIACLSMLTIDAVPAPNGDLIVTCHSGKPDWGTGPKGKGKLFKISYNDTNAPQPVLAYAASPTETRIVFDRPVDLLAFKNLTKHSSITFGKYVTAGDRFESIRPGYKVVENQLKEPRFDLPIFGATISSDRRAISLQTAPRIKALNYAATLPDPKPISSPSQLKGEKAEVRGEMIQTTLDLLTDLTGVEASWNDSSGKEQWTGWLPHLDLSVGRAFTTASQEHQRLFDLLTKPGTLTLQAQLDLWQMLRAPTQPGSKLDFEYPQETVTVEIKAGAPFTIAAPSNEKVKRANQKEARFTNQTKEGHWLPVEISLKTGNGEPRLDLSWHTTEDPRPRALPLRRILLPFARPAGSESSPARQVPEIADGNWQAGKKLFFSDQLACFKCHQVGNEGGKLGPDLTHLPYRDYASVVKDIMQPSAAINPEHLAYNVELKDGDVKNGVIVADDGKILELGLANGTTEKIAKSQIARIEPSAISLMPENLLQASNSQQRKDLLTFLLTDPTEPAP
jgi:putative heme-binding domain-containing protein